jgi:hypothetical protein
VVVVVDVVVEVVVVVDVVEVVVVEDVVQSLKVLVLPNSASTPLSAGLQNPPLSSAVILSLCRPFDTLVI